MLERPLTNAFRSLVRRVHPGLSCASFWIAKREITSLFRFGLGGLNRPPIKSNKGSEAGTGMESVRPGTHSRLAGGCPAIEEGVRLFAVEFFPDARCKGCENKKIPSQVHQCLICFGDRLRLITALFLFYS
jgi:hypothetical protein